MSAILRLSDCSGTYLLLIRCPRPPPPPRKIDGIVSGHSEGAGQTRWSYWVGGIAGYLWSTILCGDPVVGTSHKMFNFTHGEM